MTATLSPYINLEDTTKEAMAFYQSIFGGDLTSSTFGEFGMEGPDATKIMHSQLVTDQGFTIMCADTPAGMERSSGSGITISLSGTDSELRGWFAALSQDGTVTTKLEKQMWGDEFGQLTDKFGVGWLVNISRTGPPQA